MTDTEMILKALNDLKSDMNVRFEKVDEHFEEVNEQLNEIDTAIGMIAEWAENVSVITKVPFAGGKTSV